MPPHRLIFLCNCCAVFFFASCLLPPSFSSSLSHSLLPPTWAWPRHMRGGHFLSCGSTYRMLWAARMRSKSAYRVFGLSINRVHLLIAHCVRVRMPVLCMCDTFSDELHLQKHSVTRTSCKSNIFVRLNERSCIFTFLKNVYQYTPVLNK